MNNTDQNIKLAVIGQPIKHSKSPILYTTAYEKLNIPMEFTAYDLSPEDLQDFVDGIENNWLGVAITMPHKQRVIPMIDGLSPLAEELQVVNALKVYNRDDKRYLYGYNTDVFGIVGALQELDVSKAQSMQILGGGATATSAVAAARDLGINTVHIVVRNPNSENEAISFAEKIGMDLTVTKMEDELSVEEDITVVTLPNFVADRFTLPENLQGKFLLDVAYDPFPTQISTLWKEAGGELTTGLSMLAYQALGQVRMHINDDQMAPLTNENEIVEAMFNNIRSS